MSPQSVFFQQSAADWIWRFVERPLDNIRWARARTKKRKELELKKNLILATILTGLMSGTAFAGTVDDVIADLTADGFTVKEVDKTLLGNYKIEAYKGTVEREVVYSPFQDKVLRDITDDEGDDNSVAGVSDDDSQDSNDDGAESGDNGGDDGGDHDSGDGGDHDSGDGGDHDSGDD